MSLDRLGFLVGTWRGEGRGDYPTIEAFNGPTTFVLETSPEDQAFIRGLLEQFGVPDLVLAMLDERGVEVII